MIFNKLLFQTDIVISLVFWVLIIMSIISWSIIFSKGLNFIKLQKLLNLSIIENNTNNKKYILEKIFPKNYNFIQTELQKNQFFLKKYLNYGMTMLASIGSSAPFIGLFGTVWGIYFALINISQEGSVSIDVVAKPMGEALIATAFGLFAAIPAVIAFNFFKKTSIEINHKYNIIFYEHK